MANGSKLTGQVTLTDHTSLDLLATDANGDIVEGSVDLSGYCPYTGANSNVDLGTYNLTATGTIQAEHLHSTDDASIADQLTVGRILVYDPSRDGLITIVAEGGGNLLSLEANDAGTSEISSTEQIYFLSNDDDFKFLQSDNVLKVNLDIVKYDIIKNETKRNSYEIESFNLDWLTKGTFFILYIHTNKKNLKKFIEPFSNEKFIYEYDWSEGSMRRLRRK